MPKHLEGTSFAPLLESPDQPWKRAAFSQYLRTGKPPYTGRSVRTGRWRYTEWHDLKGKAAGMELYVELNDPQKTVNRANDPAHAETVKQMAEHLKAGWKAALP